MRRIPGTTVAAWALGVLLLVLGTGCGSAPNTSGASTTASSLGVGGGNPTLSPTVASTPTPTPTPAPTPRPATPPPVAPTKAPPPPPPAVPTCGAPANPWGYTFCRGNFISSPAADFCSVFNCIASFWSSTNGYVEECADTTYSHSGGRSGSCSHHGGNLRALLGP